MDLGLVSRGQAPRDYLFIADKKTLNKDAGTVQGPALLLKPHLLTHHAYPPTPGLSCGHTYLFCDFRVQGSGLGSKVQVSGFRFS